MHNFSTHNEIMSCFLSINEKEKAKLDKYLEFLDETGVSKIIDEELNSSQETRGRNPFNPYKLFATIAYSFSKHSSSLRKIEESINYDLRFIYLMEQEHPSYVTISKFVNSVMVKRQREIFSCIVNRLLIKYKIPTEDVFIDGTKLEANANKYKFVWKPIKHHKNLSVKIGNIIKEYNLISNYNDEVMIKSSTVAYAITHLKEKENEFDAITFYKLNKTLSALLDKVMEYEEKEEICGPNRKSYYKTDHDSTVMALKADYYSGLGSNMHAAYNVQLLVIMGYVFSYHVSQERTDINVFIDVIDRFARLYSFFPKRICADAGYGSLDNYRYLDKRNIENYVKHQSWEGNKSGGNPDCYHLNNDNTITCLNGFIGHEVKLENRHPRRKEAVFYRIDGCNSCLWMPFCKKYMRLQNEDFKIFEVVKDLERYKYKAQENLCSPKGIEIRVNRSIQVEGVFGITKQDYGYTRTRRRGIEKVSTEIMLNSLGLNIAKLFRYFETGKLNSFWKAPDNLEPEEFKKPNRKRLVKKGNKINQAMIDNLYSKPQ